MPRDKVFIGLWRGMQCELPLVEFIRNWHRLGYTLDAHRCDHPVNGDVVLNLKMLGHQIGGGMGPDLISAAGKVGDLFSAIPHEEMVEWFEAKYPDIHELEAEFWVAAAWWSDVIMHNACRSTFPDLRFNPESIRKFRCKLFEQLVYSWDNGSISKFNGRIKLVSCGGWSEELQCAGDSTIGNIVCEKPQDTVMYIEPGHIRLGHGRRSSFRTIYPLDVATGVITYQRPWMLKNFISHPPAAGEWTSFTWWAKTDADALLKEAAGRIFQQEDVPEEGNSDGVEVSLHWDRTLYRKVEIAPGGDIRLVHPKRSAGWDRIMGAVNGKKQAPAQGGDGSAEARQDVVLAPEDGVERQL